MLKVTNVQNGKSVVVKVTDRGPYERGRIIDLSGGAARELGILSQGVAMVTVELAEDLIIPFKPKEDKRLYEIDFDTQDPGPVMTPVWQDMKKAQHKESKPLHKRGANSTKNKQQTPAEKKNSVGSHQVVSHPQASVFDEIDKNPHKSRVSQKRNKDK